MLDLLQCLALPLDRVGDRFPNVGIKADFFDRPELGRLVHTKGLWGMPLDPITAQVIQNRLSGIVQEMQTNIFRTGYSTIVRESQDMT